MRVNNGFTIDGLGWLVDKLGLTVDGLGLTIDRLGLTIDRLGLTIDRLGLTIVRLDLQDDSISRMLVAWLYDNLVVVTVRPDSHMGFFRDILHHQD